MRADADTVYNARRILDVGDGEMSPTLFGDTAPAPSTAALKHNG